MKLKAKIILPSTVMILLTCLTGYLLFQNVISSLLDRRFEQTRTIYHDRFQSNAQTIYNSYNNDIDRMSQKALEEAAFFSRMPQVVEAYQLAHTGNIDDEADPKCQEARDQLRRLFAPIIAGYKSNTGHPDFQLHFHLPNGRSLVRLWREGWQTTRDGQKIDVSDDISSFRQTVMQINSGNHDPIMGIEIGRGGFVIRGLTAIQDESGNHLGSNEVLLSFDSLFKKMNLTEDQHLAVYMKKDFLDIATKLADPEKNPQIDDRYIFIASTNPEITSPLVNGALLDNGLDSMSSLQPIDNFQVCTFPVKDFSDQTIGVVMLAQDITQLQNEMLALQDCGKDQKYSLARSSIALVLLFTVLTAGCLYLIAGRIIKPVNSTVTMLKDIAQGKGDLTRRLQILSRDEIGDLAHYFNLFIENMQSIIKQILQNAQSLASSSTELSTTSQALSEETTQITSQSETITHSTSTMTGNMDNISNITGQMSAKVRNAADTIEQLSSSINEIAVSSEQASSIANKASGLADSSATDMSQLIQATTEIGKVVEVIQDIAEQTNLLALNATIEAARAGDAGKGFAVVANEVKELARQTAQSTEDIAQRVQAIQDSSNRSTHSLKEIQDVVKNLNGISQTIAAAVEEQNVTSQEVARQITQTSEDSDSVNQGVTQTATVTSEIAGQIGSMNDNVKKTSLNTRKISTASVELSRMSQTLHELVSQFTI